jgi:hypothetical protein
MRTKILRGLLGLTLFWSFMGVLWWRPNIVAIGVGVLLVLYVSLMIFLWSGGFD